MAAAAAVVVEQICGGSSGNLGGRDEDGRGRLDVANYREGHAMVVGGTTRGVTGDEGMRGGG